MSKLSPGQWNRVIKNILVVENPTKTSSCQFETVFPKPGASFVKINYHTLDSMDKIHPQLIIQDQ
jgi:hypothetical protein